jgi:hypothetical protein
MLGIGIAFDALLVRSNAPCRVVKALPFVRGPYLDQHPVIDVATDPIRIKNRNHCPVDVCCLHENLPGSLDKNYKVCSQTMVTDGRSKGRGVASVIVAVALG